MEIHRAAARHCKNGGVDKVGKMHGHQKVRVQRAKAIKGFGCSQVAGAERICAGYRGAPRFDLVLMSRFVAVA